MTDEQQEFRPWQTWADVPDEAKAQLLQGPFKKPLQLEAGDSLYDALRKILAALCLLLAFALPARGQTTATVTGNVKDLSTGTISSGTFVRLYLRGCAGNQPRVAGVAVIGPTLGNVFYKDFIPNASGVISGTVYATRDSTGLLGGSVECGGSTTAEWYGVTWSINGKFGPEMPIQAKAGSTIDLSNITPITTNPVITAPTGDSTYARLDAGNQPFTGAVTVPQIDKTIWVDGVKYPNTSVGINQAITDAIALGTGAVVDARGVPSVNLTAEIDVGDTTGLHSVTLLLPPSSAWTWNMTDGTSCGIKIFSKSAVIGQPSINTVATLGTTAGANMRAVVCTDTTGTFNYSRAEGFNLSVPSGAVLAKSALDVEVQADGSLFRSIKVFMSGQTGIFMRDVCCGAEFSNIVVDGQSAAGSKPMVIGATSGGFINGGVQQVACMNCSIDHPGTGINNVSFASNINTNNVTFNSLYMEPNSTDTTTPLFQIPASVYAVHVVSAMASNFAGGSTAYMFDIANWAGPSGSVFEGIKSQKLNLVNDHINSVTVVGAANGQASGYSSGTFALSALDLPEIVTAPTGVASHELLSGDPVDHMIHQNLNNSGNQHLPYTVVMSAQYTNATTVFSTITDGTHSMTFPVNASQSYTLNCTFAVQGSVGTAGPKFQATGPSAPTSVRLFVDGGTNATAYADAVTSPFSAANTALGSLGATATDFVAHVHLSLANGVNAGTVVLQAAANGAGTLTIDTGDCVWQ